MSNTPLRGNTWKIACFGQLLDHRESHPSGQGEFEI